MNTAVINIKTQPEVKAKAKEIANDLGISLTVLLNSFLKHFVKTKKVTFDLDDEEPSDYLISVIKKAEENRRKGKSSPVFDNAEDSIKWLEKQGI